MTNPTKAMVGPEQTSDSTEPLVGAQEIMALFGWKSRTTLTKYISHGLPCHRGPLGATPLFRKSAVLEWWTSFDNPNHTPTTREK